MVDAQVNQRLPKLKVFVVLWIAGMVGVCSLVFALATSVDEEQLPVPPAVAWVLTLVEYGVLLTLAVWVGMVIAPRIGLAAPVCAAICTRGKIGGAFVPQILPALVGGALVAVTGRLLTSAVKPHMPEGFAEGAEEIGGATSILAIALFGGITEELLLRWGFMTLMVWIVWRVFQKRNRTLAAGCYWAGIGISAFGFAAGHLPGVALAVPEMSALIVVYVLCANVIGGLVFGWLFWRRGLEAAMLAHLISHLAGAALNSIGF